MIVKKTPDERLLDAELDFIMNAPQEHFDAYLAETGADIVQMDRKAMLAFDGALENHQKANIASEALANLTISQQKVVANNLGIRRQVLTGFREHRVVVSSISDGFLRRLANELGQATDALARALLGPAPAALMGSYKSDEKPNATSMRVTFEQLLKEANMSEEEIGRLLHGD
ncbi:MAG: hypothetical protein Q8O64_19920 [Sideroxyarcus sp.]|nr:hypothetical protein [Sideroxyarcus sp.]